MLADTQRNSQRLELSAYNSVFLYLTRIFAAQCVLVGHLFSFLDLTVLAKQTYFPAIQSIAVNVFFMMSGFLTDFSLQRKMNAPQQNPYKLSTYVYNHIDRIFGSLIPALLFIALLDGIAIRLFSGAYGYSDSYTWKTFLKNITFFPHNFVPFGTGRPLWTLYYEWWLYMVLGYGYLVCKRNLDNGKLKVWQMIVLLGLIWVPFRGAIPATIVAFLLGIIVNRIYPKVEAKYSVGLLATGVVFVLWGLLSKDAYDLICPVLLAIMLLQMVTYGCQRNNTWPDSVKKAIKFLAGCTYPLYLTHYTIIVFLLLAMPAVRGWRLFAIAFVLSNLFAVAFYALEQLIRKGLKNVKRQK